MIVHCGRRHEPGTQSGETFTPSRLEGRLQDGVSLGKLPLAKYPLGQCRSFESFLSVVQRLMWFHNGGTHCFGCTVPYSESFRHRCLGSALSLRDSSDYGVLSLSCLSSTGTSLCGLYFWIFTWRPPTCDFRPPLAEPGMHHPLSKPLVYASLLLWRMGVPITLPGLLKCPISGLGSPTSTCIASCGPFLACTDDVGFCCAFGHDQPLLFLPRCLIDTSVALGYQPRKTEHAATTFSSEALFETYLRWLAPKRRIGGSGTSASLFPAWTFCMLGTFARLFVPFFSSLALLAFCALCRLLLGALPCLPPSARRLLSTSPSPGFVCVVRGWDVGSVGFNRAAVLSWAPLSTAKPGRKPARGGHRSLPLCTRFLLTVLGFAHLPLSVWAAPEEHVSAVRNIQAFLHHFPDQLGDRVDARVGARPVSAPAAIASPLTGMPKHCAVCQADFPVQHLLVYEDTPCTTEAFIQGAVELQAPSMTDHTLHPTEPQVIAGMASLVAVPDWMHNTDKTVYVLDFSFWGGPVFAVVDWRYVNLTSFAALARKFSPVPWQVTHGRRDSVLLPGASIFAIPGDVFRFTPLGHPTSPRPTFEQLLTDEGLWDANPSIPREIAHNHWLVLRSHVTRTPIYAGESHEELLHLAAEACHSEVNDLDFGSPSPNGPLKDLVYQGQSIRGVIAAEPRAPSGARLGVFVFVDSRLLGLSPSFRYCPAGWVDLTYFTAFLALNPPSGYTLTAHGVPLEGDRVLVSDRCTLQLRYVCSEPEASAAAHTHRTNEAWLILALPQMCRHRLRSAKTPQHTLGGKTYLRRILRKL